MTLVFNLKSSVCDYSTYFHSIYVDTSVLGLSDQELSMSHEFVI